MVRSNNPGGFSSSQSVRRTIVEFAAIALGLLVVILAGRFVVGCAAERAALALPPSVDRKIGEAASQAFLAGHLGSAPPPEQAARVERVFSELVGELTADQREALGTPEVSLVLDETANAFALPGGRVFVLTGLLELVGEGDAGDTRLRGVLAHELGHAVERHAVRSLARRTAFGLVVGLLMGNGDRLGDTLLAGASQLEYLRNSREMETEADDFGVTLLRKSGHDSTGLAEFLEKLDAQPVPELLSTHPDPGDRAARIRESAAR